MGYGCCICNETLYQKTKSSVIVGDTSKTERPVVASKCGHLFHNDCLKNWFIKQGSEVWTTRHCPNCDQTLTVATDIIRLFPHAATDAQSEDLDDANNRIKKLQSDKDELVKRLEAAFINSRESQKSYNKLEKDSNRRKAHESNLREEIAQLRRENDDLKNTVVRLSNNMMRGESNAAAAAAAGFVAASPMPPPQPQFYTPYPVGVGYVNRPNFQAQPQQIHNPYTTATTIVNGGGSSMPSTSNNGFHSPYNNLQPDRYKSDGGQAFRSGPRPKMAANKLSSKSKYDHYIAEYNRMLQKTSGKNKEKYGVGASGHDSSENDTSSDFEVETRRGKRNKDNPSSSRENGHKSDGDEKTSKYFPFFRNGSSSPGASSLGGGNQGKTSPSPDDFFENFFKNTDESDMMKFIEEEQTILAEKLAAQSLGQNSNNSVSSRRIFGKYKCTKCGSKWGSAKTDENTLQKCAKCHNEVFPYEQGPVMNKQELRAYRKRF